MHMTKSLKAKNHIVFSCNKKNFKKYVLTCILALITSLLKSREFGQYFKNYKKNILFFLVSRITNFYIEHIPDIKKIFLLMTWNN